MKKLMMVFLGLLIICSVFGSEPAPNTESKDGTDEIISLKKMVNPLKDIKDIADVTMPDRRKILKTIVEHFPSARSAQAAQGEVYTRNLLTCVNWLTSCDFGNREMENAICQQMVLDGLSYADKIPLRHEFRFVSQIRLGPSVNIDATGERVTGREWQALRKQLLEYRLHLWRRIERIIDPDWSRDGPSLKPIPPGDGAVGMAPESIQNPEHREKYKAELETYRRKGERDMEQGNARKLRNRYLPHLKKAISGLYSLQPVSSNGLEVLKSYLRIYVADKKLRAELFQRARKAAQGK